MSDKEPRDHWLEHRGRGQSGAYAAYAGRVRAGEGAEQERQGLLTCNTVTLVAELRIQRGGKGQTREIMRGPWGHPDARCLWLDPEDGEKSGQILDRVQGLTRMVLLMDVRQNSFGAEYLDK